MKKIVFMMLCMIMIIIPMAYAEVTDEDLREGIAAYWSLDDLTDSTGNFSDLNASGDPQPVTGQVNGAYDFDGNDGFDTNINSNRLSSTNFSIYGWINVDIVSGYQALLGTSHPIFIRLHDNQVNFAIRDSSTPWNELYSVSTVSIDTWYHIVATYDTANNNMSIYINGEHDNSMIANGDPAESGSNFFIGSVETSNYIDGTVDEAGIAEKVYNHQEVQELYDRQYNNLEGSQYNFTSEEIIVSPQITLNFTNTTDTGIFKSVFTLGQNFFTYVNHSLDNGTVLKNSNCSVYSPNATYEHFLNNDSFSLSLDDEYTESVELCTYCGTDIITDSVHAKVCSSNGNGNLNISVQCGENKSFKEFGGAVMPDCSNNNATLFNYFDQCKDFNSVNVTFKNSELNNIIYITNPAYDRQFKNLTLNAAYNDTIGLYKTEFYEYYTSGVFNITAQCINPEPSYSISGNKLIIINNTAPLIFFDKIIDPDNNEYNITDNMVIEFYAGDYTFLYDEFDSNTQNISTFLYDKNDNLLFSDIDTSDDSIIPSSLLVDYIDKNPFTFVVIAQDTSDLSNSENFTFYVNDTITPNIEDVAPSDLFDNTSIMTRGEEFNFNIQYTDEAIYKINFSLYLADGTVLYNFSQQYNDTIESAALLDSLDDTNITVDDTVYGKAYIADAHTNKDVKKYLKDNVKIKIKQDDKDPESKTKTFSIMSQDFKYEILDKTKSVSLDYMDDRVAQYIELSQKSSQLHIRIYPYDNTDHSIYEYKDHGQIIIRSYWIDFLSDNTQDVDVIYNDIGGYYDVYVTFDMKLKYVQFNSIGIVNEKQIDFFVTLEDADEPAVTDTSSVGAMIFLGIIIFIWLFFLLFPFIIGSPVFNIFTGFISFIVGIIMHAYAPSDNNMNLLLMIFIMAIGLVYFGIYFTAIGSGKKRFNLKNIKI